MKAFTDSEMIRVAKAAGIYTGDRLKSYSTFGTLSYVYTWGYESMTYDVSNNMFAIIDNASDEAHEFDILAVADTIREILKEREV
jgi:hypothetical protein